MENINELVTKLGIDKNLQLEDIPNIDLYMDQVIQLFESSFADTRRNHSEKVLTKTMINNYAKGKLFFPIKNKKYSKEHIILISLIYQLKGALSINDIKLTLEDLNENVMEQGLDLDQFYNSYLNLYQQNANNFKNGLNDHVQDIQQEISSIEDSSKYLEKVLLISSLVNISNFYKRAAEKLVDEIAEAKAHKQIEERKKKAAKPKGV